MKPYIYCYLDKTKNKIIYVGKTNGYSKNYRTGSKILKRYISIYGYENFDNRFDRNILQYCSSIDLNDLEEYWITYYNTCKCGVNLTKGGRFDWNRKNEKPILQYDLDGLFIREWGYAKQPIKEGVGTDYNGISACCLGKQLTSNGFIWRFKTQDYPLQLDVIPRMDYPKNVKRIKNQRIEIEGKQYNSITQAANDLGWTFGKLNGKIKKDLILYKWIK